MHLYMVYNVQHCTVYLYAQHIVPKHDIQCTILYLILPQVLQRYPIETDIYQLLQLACQIKDGKLILHTVPTKENPAPNSTSGRSGILGSFFSRAKNR